MTTTLTVLIIALIFGAYLWWGYRLFKERARQTKNLDMHAGFRKNPKLFIFFILLSSLVLPLLRLRHWKKRQIPASKKPA